MSAPVFFFRSSLLAQGPIVAGFSTRDGGDDVDGLAAAAGFVTAKLYQVTQVHGREVVVLTGAESPAEVALHRADALVTATPGVVVAVRTADCVPIVLAAQGPGGPAVAAVHAGWRGLVAGVIPAAVSVLCRVAGAAVGAVHAAVGPAIDSCCFEVGPEVAEQLVTGVGDRSLIHDGATGRPFVDLRGAARRSLRRAGLAAERIELIGPCTRCASSLLHSYRREGPGQGRQLSFVTIATGSGKH